MKMTNQNFWTMLKDTLAFFDTDPTEWINFIILKANVEKLRSIEKQINEADKLQKAKDPSSHTTEKDQQYEKMTQQGHKLGCKVASYALETENTVLLEAVSFSPTQLEQGTEIEVTTRCQIIADKALENLTELKDYSVTKEGIDAYQATIDKFKKMPPARDVVTNERKSAVRSISELAKEARALFKKLDKNVDGFVENTTFIDDYHQIRSINSRRGGRSTNKTEQPPAQS